MLASWRTLIAVDRLCLLCSWVVRCSSLQSECKGYVGSVTVIDDGPVCYDVEAGTFTHIFKNFFDIFHVLSFKSSSQTHRYALKSWKVMIATIFLF